MFSRVCRVCRWQLYYTLVLLPSRIFVHILGTLFPVHGIQKGKTSVEGVVGSSRGIPARTEIHCENTVSIEEATNVISNGTSGQVVYSPTVEKVLSYGSTSTIGRLKPGVVLKSPRFSWWTSPVAEINDSVKHIKHSFSVEEQIIGILGEHPRIIPFLGLSEDPKGLLFAEASGGSLQAYLDRYNDTIDITLRMKWRTQATEAIQYIHGEGVIHSDLRPDNYLLHGSVKGVLNLYLTDFGGSTCGDLDGGHLPDSGFFNPRNPWVSTEATDIFSLGSVFYTIMTGHWPYKSPGPFKSVDEKFRYDEEVDKLFYQGKFPTVKDLVGGAIIQGCWTEEYKSAETVLHEQKRLFEEASMSVERRNAGAEPSRYPGIIAIAEN